MANPLSAAEEARQNELEAQLFEDVTRTMHTSAWMGIGPEATASALARSIAFVLITACTTEASRKEIRDLMPEMIELHQKQLLAEIAKKEAAEAAAKRARSHH